MSKLTSIKRDQAKTYWEKTCNPHTVGMCTLLGRAAQCGPAWAEQPDTHPLHWLGNRYRWAATTKHERMGGLCDMISDDAFVMVKASPGGILTCPLDTVNVHDSKALSDAKAACKAAKGCEVFKLRDACRRVAKRMIKAQKKKGTECAWPNSASAEGDTDVMPVFERCKRLYKCFDPFLERASTTSKPMSKMSTPMVLNTIQKRMDSMDYMSETRTGPLKSPEEATRELFQDLQKLLDQSQMRQAELESSGLSCQHRWKMSPSHT